MSAGRTALRTALVAVAVVVADQLTKAIVRGQISRFEEHELFLGIKLINTRNTGVAFSMFSGGGPLVVIIAFVALAALIAFFVTHIHRRLVWLPTGPAARRRGGQPDRPDPARRRHRLHQDPALAGVQRRRHLRHASACCP